MTIMSDTPVPDVRIVDREIDGLGSIDIEALAALTVVLFARAAASADAGEVEPARPRVRWRRPDLVTRYSVPHSWR